MRQFKSFPKQEPPNPIEGFRYLLPILESEPTHLAISSTSAPTLSQIDVRLLMDETLYAKNEFATNFDSSDEKVFVSIILS